MPMTMSDRSADQERLHAQLCERNPEVESDLAPLATELRSAEREVRTILGQPEFNQFGKQKRTGERCDKSRTFLDAYDQATAALLPQLTERQDADIRELVGKATPENAAILGPWLMAKPHAEQLRETFAAIDKEDWQTVATVLNLPAAVSPLDESTRAKVRDRLLAKLRPEKTATLAKLQNRIAARQMAAESGRRLLADLRTLA